MYDKDILVITYNPEKGICVPDGRTYDVAKEILDHQIKNIYVSQEAIIHWIRVLVKEGYIDNEKIVFKFNDIYLNVDKYGVIDYYPEGFCDLTEQYLERLLG